MLVNKSLKKLHEDNKINFNNSTIKGEHFMKIGWGMTSWECYENKWFYMKYIGKYMNLNKNRRWTQKPRFSQGLSDII
jgi:hypothetical protein